MGVEGRSEHTRGLVRQTAGGFKSEQEDFEFNSRLAWEPVELLGDSSDAF